MLNVSHITLSTKQYYVPVHMQDAGSVVLLYIVGDGGQGLEWVIMCSELHSSPTHESTHVTSLMSYLK